MNKISDVILTAAILYGWIWVASWWSTHLSEEGWIAFCQAVTITIISCCLLILFLATFFNWTESGRKR